MTDCVRRLVLAFLLLAAAFAVGGAPATADAAKPVDLVLFYGRGCPHCAAMRAFLDAIEPRYPELRVRDFEVYFDGPNARLFERMAEAYKFRIEGVPTAFLGDRVFSGYSEDIQPEIEQAIKSCLVRQCPSPLDRVAGEAQRAPLLTFGAVVSAASVDAINPCAFAVLTILLAAVVAAGGRRRALFAGLAFSLAVFLSYFLMGLGLYSAIEAAGLSRGLYVAVAVLAILLGLFNMKDYLWYGKWFLMEVPLSWRPTLKRIIGGVTSVPGAFFVGFLISLFLLPCTSGPYIVILGLLAKIETRAAALAWLVLYNIVFVTPMVAITAAAYFGFTTAERAEEWRARNLRRLHLIAGVIILALGVVMVAALWLGYA
jgi:cytochrome c biogenesis protein CcdA/glutaredoxin